MFSTLLSTTHRDTVKPGIRNNGMLQLANHSNIALNKEMLPLLHPLDGFTSILQSTYKRQE